MNSLLDKKFATGGQIVETSVKFLWKGEVVDMNYVTIHCYTTNIHKEALKEDVENTSIEEVPMITFVAPDDLNKKLRDWIDRTLA